MGIETSHFSDSSSCLFIRVNHLKAYVNSVFMWKYKYGIYYSK